MDFGSKEWQEYYHGQNKGHRVIGDLAKRSRKALQASMTKKALVPEDDRRNAELAEESALADSASDHLDVLTNAGKGHTLTVKVMAKGLPQSIAVGLMANGFKFSQRRGGMYWAPRTDETVKIAYSLMR